MINRLYTICLDEQHACKESVSYEAPPWLAPKQKNMKI